MKLTVLFDAPYWVGVLEVERDGRLYVAKHIFGAEPSDQVVYEFVQHDLLALQARMIASVPIEESQQERHLNPKRVQREVRRELAMPGISTKSQEVMRLQLEQNKQERQIVNREARDELRDYKREVAREKAKAKHRGH